MQAPLSVAEINSWFRAARKRKSLLYLESGGNRYQIKFARHAPSQSVEVWAINKWGEDWRTVAPSDKLIIA